jgi:hypothetical protein
MGVAKAPQKPKTRLFAARFRRASYGEFVSKVNLRPASA